MAFDNSAFMNAKFRPRSDDIKLEALQIFFGDDEPIWTVRGQTASELARAIESSSKQKNLDSIIKAIGSNKSQIDDLKAAIGLGDDTPADVIKRLEMLSVCSVSPVIDLPVAIKLAENFPIEFYILTNKITELTGLGADVKKPKCSGETRALEVG